MLIILKTNGKFFEGVVIMQPVKKVLIPIDGSSQSVSAVRYAGSVFKPEGSKIVLLHVDSEIPESFWDLEKSPEYRSKLAPVRAWATHQKKIINASVNKACKILYTAGFQPDAVSVKIEGRKAGIARDILNEADTGGYNAVVVGRTGNSNLKDIVLGSVANKLIGNLVNIPLVIVGGKPNPKKFLIAFDGSKGSMKCVSSAGSMLNNTDCEIMLCNVIRSIGTARQGLSEASFSDIVTDWTEMNRRKIEPAVEEAKRKLVSAGIASSRISAKILTEKSSRAGSILVEAKEGGFGTILVGRRGLSAVDEFFIGRVSRKILHMAKKMAVWVVN
ncbi:MAG: Universal stress protein [Thermodesulfobacteriota bacterium]|nr:Universal stress protein [Thermodesulfobacteriota bacterium]